MNEECDKKNSRQVWRKIGKHLMDLNGRCLTFGDLTVGLATCGMQDLSQNLCFLPVTYTSPGIKPELYPCRSRRFRNRSLRRCLVAATKDSTWSMSCNGSPAEEWYQLPDESIRNKWNNRCMDGKDEDLVTTELCDSNKGQLWEPLPLSRLKNMETGNCLEAGDHFAYTASCVLDNHDQQFQQW